jgi:signal transduction histidine kinase
LGIEVIKEYGKLPLIECYAGQLNQVFMNILTNAIDALEERDQQRTWQQIKPSSSRIYIRTQMLNEHQISIKIRDNALGIPENIKQLIFDPFFTTKPIGKGTGMGMSISYQIITKNHGGNLYYISYPGQGTEFVIEIPLKQQVKSYSRG